MDKRKKVKRKCAIGDLARAADIKKTFFFSKGDTTIWSYKFYEITEEVFETIPSYRFDNLPERYNEPSLKRTNLTLKENKSVRKN